MAVVVLAGMDPLPLLRSRDPVLMTAVQAIAKRVLIERRKRDEARDRNLAVAIGNQVGKAVSRLLRAK